jgi:hypothetical protein
MESVHRPTINGSLNGEYRRQKSGNLACQFEVVARPGTHPRSILPRVWQFAGGFQPPHVATPEQVPPATPYAIKPTFHVERLWIFASRIPDRVFIYL